MKKQDLSQMGEAHVSIGRFGGEPCIYKKGASNVELDFYKFAADKLDGVSTPKLLDISGNNLVIEYIPHSVTLEELHASNCVFEQLAAIHSSNYQPEFLVKNHDWKVCATDSAMNTLNFPKVTQESIKNIQKLSSELFEYNSLISGDSNEGNWGIRDNGEFVLFDWERFGRGSPAIDLAPLVKGLGSSSDYEAIIEKYSRSTSELPSEQLHRHLILAKVWILVEVTNILTQRGKSSASMYFKWFRENVPSWLSSVENAL
ncbi:choline kinase [Vibrio harveyi]|uniref:choline kinase n=1 Tax=Vibrio harveyi TaxID=669 RepID=UPI0023803DB6|nr:choline kinase [Vibrio harveyi]